MSEYAYIETLCTLLLLERPTAQVRINSCGELWIKTREHPRTEVFVWCSYYSSLRPKYSVRAVSTSAHVILHEICHGYARRDDRWVEHGLRETRDLLVRFVDAAEIS